MGFAISKYDTPRWMLTDMEEMVANKTTYNFVGTIENMSKENLILETPLWTKAALEAYTDFNMGKYISRERYELFNSDRGGPQGDYSSTLPDGILLVKQALSSKLTSKRAVLTIPPFTSGTLRKVDLDKDDQHWKCLRELYFRIEEDGKLHCTGTMRSQAVNIFAKNIHLIGTVMHHIASHMGVEVGTYTHFAHFLCKDRF